MTERLGPSGGVPARGEARAGGQPAGGAPALGERGPGEPAPPHFAMPLTIRFQHCDPAGIVFFPRYYEMTNLTVERFFEETLGASFHALHIERRVSVPTVRIETEFRAPSRLEDRVRFGLTVERVGSSSARFRIECRGDADDLRLASTHTLVAVDMETGRSRPWPDAIGTRLREIARA